ncbi:MAG: hypothetical protein WD336_07235 [Trueperaceae bacterium]
MTWRRSSPDAALPLLEPAHRALAEGRIEAAVALLADAAAASSSGSDRALCQLHLASAASLHGGEGMDRGLQALRAAAGADPSVVRWPLYRALHWEFRAAQGAAAHQGRRGGSDVDAADDPLAAYHAASALWRSGATRSTLRRLEAIPADAVPEHLRWRRWSLLGHVHADAASWTEAAEAFERSFAEAPLPERETERIHLAGAWLERGDPGRAQRLLRAGDLDPVDRADRSWALQLRGRAELELGNPGRALRILQTAERIAPDADHRYGALQAIAQALQSLGRPGDAADRLQDALADAGETDRAYALHERAVALLDAGRPEDATAALDEALLDPDYPHRAEATADLADAHLRTGDLVHAAGTARHALDLGATGPACLVLGTVALEYYDMDEAAAWFEQAASASPPGDPVWVAAQQSLADVFAQRGSAWAQRLLTHARLALEHTEPASEWTASLERYVQQARHDLGGRDRQVN